MTVWGEKGSSFGTSAYGGVGWVPRQLSHANEFGKQWASYRIDSEWRKLKAVIVHTPGSELAEDLDLEKSLMLEPLDSAKSREEHEAMCEAYRAQGVEVHHVSPVGKTTPNQMFCADLFVMTSQGAIIARPAGEVRAGEERLIARRLADIGVPILKTLTGSATFEGADLMWLDERTAMIGRGHRTNQEAIDQITSVLKEIGCETITVDMPFGTMHFMGMLRIVDKDLAVCWPRRTPLATVRALEARGIEVIFPPYEDNTQSYRAMNFVTLGPRRVMMVAGLRKYQAFFEDHDVECFTVGTDELSKAAGSVGCLTGVLARETAT
ncbi:dimethylarginine dimethylaminohydrolase family protein [Agrobacterium sp. NPDC089420]|uniref:dimethylarginine dimethylaminohydrolase family protein n=1 Tax=Agrobacterium sp. NPDC089420 TaxID=3363918 RepID=UPI00384B8B51